MRICRIFGLIVLAFTFSIAFCNSIYAVPTTKIEQQIVLTDQLFYTTQTSVDPTDNSLGLYLHDGSAYNFETVMFEAVLYCNSCSGGAASAVATLYDSTGNAVTGGSVSTSATSYTRVRTTDIAANLVDNTQYTVRLKVDATSGTAYLLSARLIITQADTAITHTRSVVDLGVNSQTSQTSYALIPDLKIFYYDADRHSQVSSIKLAGTLKNSTAGGTSYLALSASSTCASTVTDSEITVTGTTWTHVLSGDIKANLADNTPYWLCYKTTNPDTASLSHSYLIITQQDNDGIDNITSFFPLSTHLQTDSDSTYTLANFHNQFNPSNLVADRKKAYFEGVLKADSSTTAYASLYNISDSVAVGSGEISTSNGSYTRVISNELFTSLPTSFKTLDVQLKNSGSSLTALTSSALVFELKETPIAALTFTVAGTSQNTVHNDITTSVASDFDTLPFGNLTATVPKYAAHALTASTNAGNGYQVTVKMLNYLQGNYPANNIDPFIAAWSSPTTWTEPTGTTPNDNTGWLGANTSDTRVTGWSSASQKFGAVNNTANTVMLASSEDAGTTIYVTYGLEVNIYQAADLYSGTLVYSILPSY